MEICVDSLESARNAVEGGAMRLEICSALSEGGLTPTPGLVKQIKEFARVPIYVMIRVRGGDFVYNREEIEAMLHDLQVLKDHQVDGFVFGALTPRGDIDPEVCQQIVSAARPLPVTFHRAFDNTTDPLAAMEVVINLGFERILTSGQKPAASEGVELLKKLVEKAGNRIIIMPGAGVTDRSHIFKIKGCGAKEIHTSAKKKVRRDAGSKLGSGEGEFIYVTSKELVQELVDAVKHN